MRYLEFMADKPAPGERGRFADRLGEGLHEGQSTMTTDVGLAIQAAIARGEAHGAMCPQPLRVRLFNYQQGLAIIVTVPARANAELDALNAGTRVIPRNDLSRHAHELPQIVDEWVAAVETALGLTAAAA
jgi:hypothetical protein